MDNSTLQIQISCEPLKDSSEEFIRSSLHSYKDKIQATSCMSLKNMADGLQIRTPNQKVVLDVGGMKHKVLWAKLEKLPHSRLGKLKCCKTEEEIKGLCDGYSLEENEYFFDWNPQSFQSILNYYRTGELHLDNNVCPLALRKDLQYWGIDEFSFESCCQNRYLQSKDDLEEMKHKLECLQRRDEDGCSQTKCSNFQKRIWNVMENPKSSLIARMVSVISVMFTILSTITIALNNLPSLQPLDSKGIAMDNPELSIVEAVCITWFTLEYLTRFSSSPNKWKFFKRGLNLIDLLVILPYFLYLYLSEFEIGMEYYREIQLLRISKILVILKLARHSKSFQILGATLHSSSKELGLFILVLYIGTMIFATLVYHFEKYEPDTLFRSTPETMWWAALAMITMNICSDNMCPTTPLGKLVGVVCCMCGVLVIALPIPVITSNFANHYEKQRMRKRYLKWINAQKKGCVGVEKNIKSS